MKITGKEFDALFHDGNDGNDGPGETAAEPAAPVPAALS